MPAVAKKRIGPRHNYRQEMPPPTLPEQPQILRDLGRHGGRRMVIARVRGKRTLLYLLDVDTPAM